MYQSKWRIVQDSQGYTLLEALFSMTVFVLLSQIVLLVFFWIQQMDVAFSTNEQVEWELFVQDMQQVLKNVKELKVSKDSKTMEVVYSETKETLEINRSGDVLRYLVNNQGNTQVLIGIQSVLFTWDGQFVTISVVFQNSIEKERRFFVQTTG